MTLEGIGYILTHPQAIIYGVATILLYPVLIAELVALVFALFEAGRFTVESYRRRRVRKKFDVEAIARLLVTRTSHVMVALSALSFSPVARRIRSSLGDGTDLSRSRVLKALADGELEASRVLERTRVLIRIGPMLGLMGTLIPISPALVALAKGDVNTLSSNLVIAFSATVVGLLIGGIGYFVTAVRDRTYQQDVVDIEYLFDRMGV